MRMGRAAGALIGDTGIRAALSASRDQVLGAIGDPQDLTLVSVPGNWGDQLIREGTRALLSGFIYRECDLEGLCSAAGHTAVLTGSGAFCRPFSELMPRALAIAGMRFERVILLPSSFDPGEDRVREALARTRATVFARERDSFERIRGLCDARLAHDGGFFFDFAPFREPGAGVLNAFRTDAERDPSGPLPDDNDDISLTAPSLEAWLRRIAAVELVHTDRAHVMIAGAMLGKRVQFRPSSYHKLSAIADYALGEFPVRQLPHEPDRSRRPAVSPRRSIPLATTPRVSAVVLVRSRPERALRAIDSIRPAGIPAETIVIDNNSPPPVAAALAEACLERESVRLHRSDRNLRCAGGRRLGTLIARGELVLFLDDDAELEPDALGRLVAELDAHPEVAAVSATVERPDGTVHHSGGWWGAREGIVEFGLIANGEPACAVPPSGPAGWVPGTAALIRRSVLERWPIDERMEGYYEDNEWGYRIESVRPGSFRRCREARVVHDLSTKLAPGSGFGARSQTIEMLAAQARFYERHRRLLGINIADLLPELCDELGVPDMAAVALVMELLIVRGADWTLMEWIGGGLDPLFAGLRLSARVREHRGTIADLQAGLARQQQVLDEQAVAIGWLNRRDEKLRRVEEGGWWQLRQRLLPGLQLWWRLRGRNGE